MSDPASIRLVAIDLDDTLLGPDHRISPANAAAVRWLVGQGLAVVLASGRMHAATIPFARELGLGGPVLSYNGALVKVADTDETIHHVPLPAEAAAEIVAFANAHDYHLNYYLDDVLYVREQDYWADLYHSRTGSVVHPVGDLAQFDGREPTKIILLDEAPVTRRLLETFAGRSSRWSALISHPEYLEFMHPRVSKAFGLHVIGERLGIVASQMIAFGDSGNDVPMLQYAGLAVAMGNATAEVKAVADVVAGSSAEDGFAHAARALITAGQ